MTHNKEANATISTAINQMLDLLKTSLSQCEQQVIATNEKSQSDSLSEAITDKKRMITQWEDEMEAQNIKIDKRTHASGKDAYPNRIEEATHGATAKMLEKELIEIRAALTNRDDLPTEFKKILANQRSYIFS